MIDLAILLVESPDAHAGAARRQLSRPISQLREWMILLGALAFTAPELLDEDLLKPLAEWFDRGAGSEDSPLAGEILKSLLDTPLAVPSLGLTVETLRQPGKRPAVYEALAGVLAHAAIWQPHLIEIETIVGLGELGHLKAQGSELAEIAFERCLAIAPQLHASLLKRCTALFAGGPQIRYWEPVLRAYGLLPQAPGAPAIQPARRLREGPCRVLVVHNMKHGQGDEIIRCGPLLQALLDGNAELNMTVVTWRPYLYSGPRTITVHVRDAGPDATLWTEPFDAVIDFYQPAAGAASSDRRVEDAVEDFIQQRSPSLSIWATNTDNQFIFEKIVAGGVDYAQLLGLNRRRVKNAYETTLRLIVELGLPLPFGSHSARNARILAGHSSPDGATGRHEATAKDHLRRPVALLNPFGGAHRLKGYTEPDGAAAEAARLIDEGYFVVVLPSGGVWGTTERVREVINLLTPERQCFAIVGPDQSDDAEMRSIIEWICGADLIVTVEGWMVHAAWCLAKPYRVLMLPYSTPDEWSPYGRSPRQQVKATALRRAWTSSSAACLPHQPRKRTLLLLLDEIGKYRFEEARPILRRALEGDDRELRLAAARAIVQFRKAEDLAPLLRDPSREVRGIGAQASLDLRYRPDRLTREQLMAHVWIGRPKLDWAPVARLGRASRPALEMAARGDEPAVRREAGQLLRALDFKAPPRPGLFTRILSRLRQKESRVGA